MGCNRDQKRRYSRFMKEPRRMPYGKQAKMLTPKQETAVLTYLQTRRYPVRDRVIFLAAPGKFESKRLCADKRVST
jgi:hypothetical protein